MVHSTPSNNNRTVGLGLPIRRDDTSLTSDFRSIVSKWINALAHAGLDTQAMAVSNNADKIVQEIQILQDHAMAQGLGGQAVPPPEQIARRADAAPIGDAEVQLPIGVYDDQLEEALRLSVAESRRAEEAELAEVISFSQAFLSSPFEENDLELARVVALSTEQTRAQPTVPTATHPAPTAAEEPEPCCICQDEIPTMTLSPCGHRILCGVCAVRLKNSDNPVCPLDRMPFDEIV